ncbi:MAG: hypothetical protein EPO09_00925 [Aquabacterium sp.]|uniref:hypothetical protein n=1 Tax=Aquabacterium sp. TaxID=1872578 RepID=UPI00122069F6|nr:hypothetical protein [Aquabacterium sp.]TAK99587.1 MAG: hypothetical protein EPO09_00925 [Aquabacterium sp.]
MASDTLFQANRVLLVHFDSYSTALVFAKWPTASLLFDAPLPAGATMGSAPEQIPSNQDGEAVKAATVARLGLNPQEVMRASDFDFWVSSDSGPVRIHLLRFTTFDAPKAALAMHEAVFKPISELRGSDKLELVLAREVFNLIIGSGGART